MFRAGRQLFIGKDGRTIERLFWLVPSAEQDGGNHPGNPAAQCQQKNQENGSTPTIKHRERRKNDTKNDPQTTHVTKINISLNFRLGISLILGF